MRRLSPYFALSAGALMLGGPALAQTLGQAPEVGVPWWRVLAALLLCLGLAVAGALALRARLGGQALPSPKALWTFSGGTPAVRRLRLIETVRLSHQVDVCLINCDDAEFMVTTSAQGAVVTPLGKTALPAEAAG